VNLQHRLNVPEALTIQEVHVDLNVTHAFIGDLLVTLSAPLGTVVTMNDHAGGGADDIHQAHVLPVEFTGQASQGPWTLGDAEEVEHFTVPDVRPTE